MNTLYGYILMTVLALPLVSHATQDHAGHAASEAAASTDTQQAFTEGEVRKVNKDTGKLTIKHGPITNLDMPAMTMVFQVSDSAMLDQVKQGDQIRFVADKIDGKYTVMQLEIVQ